ncbi:MAG: hypothetical protein ACREC0_02030 [Methylocella sp.]
MRHVTLFLAAATVVFGSGTALWADPFPAANSTEISTRNPGLAPVTVPADSAPAPAVVPAPSPVAEIAADPAMKGQPEEVKSGPTWHAEHSVLPPRRHVTHRVGLGCFSSHQHSARVARPTWAARIAVPRATAWLAASGEPQCGSRRCSQFVLLGVGY